MVDSSSLLWSISHAAKPVKYIRFLRDRLVAVAANLSFDWVFPTDYQTVSVDFPSLGKNKL